MKLITGPAAFAGPTALLDGHGCSLLATLLGRAVRAAVAHGEALDRETLDYIEGIEFVAAWWRASAGGSLEGNFPPLELEPEDDDITVDEAAKLLGKTPRRVRQLLQAGQLPGRKFGTTWKVDRDGIRRRIEEGFQRHAT